MDERNRAREAAIVAGRAIFYRPERFVDAQLARFSALSDAEYPGTGAVTRACHELPIRMGATFEVFALRALHWPMLNLLDAAAQQRRNFADALAAAIASARSSQLRG